MTPSRLNQALNQALSPLAHSLQALQATAHRHPRRVSAAVLAMLAGSAVTAFGVAPLSVLPEVAPPVITQITQAVEPADLSVQLQRLDLQSLRLYRSEVTRSADTADSLLKRLGVDDMEAAQFVRNDPVASTILQGRLGKSVKAIVEDGKLIELVVRGPADTTSDMTASTTMAAPVCELPCWTSLRHPISYMSATTWAPGVCEHNPNRADGSEQWVQSVSSSTFEPAICIDNPFLNNLSINWQLGSEHLEDMCASPHTTSQAIEHMPQPAPEAAFTHGGHFDFPPLRSQPHVHPCPKSQLGSTALTIVGHGPSATTQPPSRLATHLSPPTLLGQCNGERLPLPPKCFTVERYI